MQLLIHPIFSLATIIIFSLADLDGFNRKTRAVAQLLVKLPLADTPNGLENPAFSLDPTSEADA